ncbi:NAD-dependent deacetylase [compost metagenome]
MMFASEPGDEPMPMDEIAKCLADANHVVVFTGAGASAESGIPTFREALTGI